MDWVEEEMEVDDAVATAIEDYDDGVEARENEREMIERTIVAVVVSSQTSHLILRKTF